ncbi:membrane protein insertase YidC [Pacificitalea manganoxidans]|uniref:Membrane protein insertase YidC n=1 Tax=Pacificitalea manganoxidans TaxID=1411902 RepID=A0A291M1U2_9RHOB|nr:membrane protein insertase YidC [Pacificitalea manganoxidans]ATI42902.1 membrane protein insertase YidC [Pacificitalea manganoxidans]MDR6307181.1 YidC/Oxa1 family membrane protein insertase [Pacificitalea manganoxidans]
MDDQNKNLILATALSFLVILGWTVFFAPPPAPEDPNAPAQVEQTAPDGGVAAVPGAADGTTAATPGAAQTVGGAPTGEVDAVADAPRVSIDTPDLQGSISLIGGRIDDLSLKSYHETLDPESEIVRLLAPVGSQSPYYALHGWAPGAGLEAGDVPGTDTEWTVAEGSTLTTDTPIVLEWESPTGLVFRRSISVDENYMFSIDQSVENPTDQTLRAAPYGIIARHGLPDLANFFILHEGVVGMADGSLTEEEYDRLAESDVNPTLGAPGTVLEDVQEGWIGFTDKYWMTTLIPTAGEVTKQVTLYQPGPNIYQTQLIYPTAEIAPGQTVSNTSLLFAGAKEWETIKAYEEAGIPGFLDSIDWGMFFFLTKPIFAVLHWLNGVLGNMGWSIIALTFCIKALLFPLAYKSYVSMAKMKELQPEMEKLKERAGDDRQKLQQEMMKLYRDKKVNPAAGCLPILLQIPIFFSLYKVIFVTIELRHAPWIGWLRDLSAPDPTSILNLFGLLPYAPPGPDSFLAILSLGVLPILLGISMFLQQKLNPAPADKTQAMIFAWMPWVFMFMLGRFASGLVLYWITNNTITFIQQYTIMRSQGYKPDVFGNITRTFRRKKTEAE